jgi:hypothetical protein
MSVLLYVVGAIAVMLGVAMVGYGIPINEFSFGNTLIVAGTTASVGGLIVVAIGVAVAQLQRLSDALGAHTVAQSDLPLDTFAPPPESRAAPPPSRMPFPSRAKLDVGRPPLHERPAAAPTPAPVMRNPEISVIEEYQETFLVAEAPMAPPGPSRADLGEAARSAPPGVNRAGMAETRHDSPLDAAWRSSPPPPPPPKSPARQPRTSYFDSMWPAAESRSAKSAVGGETEPESPDLPSRESAPAPEPPPPRPGAEPRAVSILKSGVIDGMGYTLFVDGSIEAELPQGTLRFASINDLRNHLAKPS